jgi:hypothetical protein
MKTCKFLAIIAIYLTVLSCSDFLDEQPTSSLVEKNMWKSYRDVRAGVNDIYFNFRSAMRYNYYNWGELRGDNFEKKTPGSGEIDKLLDNLLTSDLSLTSWTQLYKTINSANAAIKHIPSASLPKEEDQRDYLAQALTMRALCYFYAVRVWGDVPVYLEPSEDLDNFQYSGRVPVDSILREVVIPDLLKAETLIKPTNRERKRISRRAIWAIMADVYLWLEEYDLVIATVDKFNSSLGASTAYKIETNMQALASIFSVDLDNKPSDNNDTSDEYGSLKELIFVIHFNMKEWDYSSWIWSLFGGGSAGTLKLSDSFSKIMTAPERVGDERGTYYMKNDAMSKFVPLGANISYSVWSECEIAYPVYRTTELYFMKAEALAHLSRWDEALSIINEDIKKRAAYSVSSPLYARAKKTSDFATQDELIDYILEEKQVEMIGEGKRWFDLIRTDRWKNLPKYTRTDIDGNPTVPEYQKLFPIHFTHIDENPGFIHQNPGY